MSTPHLRERLPIRRAVLRTTSRLHHAHDAIGHALGGEAGSRLTMRLAVTTSPDTLLRRVKKRLAVTTSPDTLLRRVRN